MQLLDFWLTYQQEENLVRFLYKLKLITFLAPHLIGIEGSWIKWKPHRESMRFKETRI